MLNKNSRVIITGATSGIGLSLVKLMSVIGVKLAVCGRDQVKMEKLLCDSEISSQICYSDSFCITHEQKIEQFVKGATNALGGVDILINCAGANTSRAPVCELAATDLDYMYQVNLRAPFIFMRDVFNFMKDKKSGVILNVHSTVCLFSNEGIGAYTASKAGFDALSNVFRKEARHHGVHLLSVYPGGVDTNFRAASRPEYMNADGVATAIIAQLNLPENVIPHELVIRPEVESNF